MNFWIIAIALLAIPAVIVSWPLFKGPAKEKIIGLFVILVLPLAGILMYQEIGTPEAIHLPSASVASQSAQQQSAHDTQGGQMDALIASVARSRGDTVVTDNTRHFENIPDLQLVNWLSR